MFSQFNEQVEGQYTKLAKKMILTLSGCYWCDDASSSLKVSTWRDILQW